jgi:ABC-type lipoprotein export system ATPase subunit
MHFETALWRYLARPVAYPCAILERGRRWDDYGHVTRFTVYYLPHKEDEGVRLGTVKILQRGELETNLPERFTSLDDQFCSLGQDVGFYERVKELGPEVSQELLLGLKDVVFTPELYKTWKDERGFRNSLLRSSSALKALHEAGGLFNSLPPLATPVKFKFRKLLPGFEAPHEIDFDFQVQEGGLGRAVVLVGRNGAGKTALLARLAYALSGLDQKDTAALSPESPKLSPIIAISYSAFDNFPRPRLRQELGVSYFYCGLRRLEPFADDRRLQSQDADRVDLDWALAVFDDAMDRMDALGRKQQWEKLLVGAGIFDETDPPEVLDVAAESFREWMSRLSSGHKIVLMILTNVLARIRPGSMLLFDEPELHLHPQLLSSLMRLLHQVLEEYDSYAVLGTHSPIVLQETPAHAVRIIERQGRYPRVARYPGESFGENLTEIVRMAFRVDDDSSNYVRIMEQLLRKMSRQQVMEFFRGNLSLQARMTLRAMEEEGNHRGTQEEAGHDEET